MMDSFHLIWIFGLCFSAKYALGVRLAIQPNSANIGDTVSTIPPITPQEIVFECKPENMGNIDAVYSINLKRNGSPFSEINTNNIPKISDNAPNDIRTKNPTIEGNVDSYTPTNSVLRARYLTSRVTCVDDDTYTCEILYKPQGELFDTVTDEERLTLTFLPGNLQITANEVVNGYPMQLQNQSIVQYNDDLEYRCTGSVGESSTTVFEWHIHNRITNLFERFQPSGSGESIDDGQVSVTVCPYTRTSILRYRVTTSNRYELIFRCETTAQLSTGGIHRAYSQPFLVSPPVIGGSTGGSYRLLPLSSAFLILMSLMARLL